MKKLVLILVTLALAVCTSVSAQEQGTSKIDSLSKSLYKAFDQKSQTRDYKIVGMDTIHQFPGGEFMTLEFRKGYKEFRGSYGLSKYVISNGVINYEIQGKKLKISSGTIDSSSDYGQDFAEATLSKLLQGLGSSGRKN